MAREDRPGRSRDPAGLHAVPIVLYGAKVTSSPSVKLKAAPPPAGSRCQNWKYQVEPAVIVVEAVGGAVTSSIFVARPVASGVTTPRRAIPVAPPPAHRKPSPKTV